MDEEDLGGVVATEVERVEKGSSLSIEGKRKLMEGSGVTDKLKYDVLYSGLTAVRKKEDYDEQGNVRIVEEPDHLVRKGYLELAFRVGGEIRPENMKMDINFNLSVEERKGVEERVGRLLRRKKVIDV